MNLTQTRQNHSSSSREPMRSCVVTRESYPQWQLLRFVLEENSGQVYLDLLNKLPGRGAYLYPSRENIRKACLKGGFSRAFKRSVKAEEATILQDLESAFSRRFSSLLAISKRAGALLPGHSQVEQTLRKEEGLLLIMAQDASEGVKNKFRRWATRNRLTVIECLSKNEIGHSIGGQPCSLLVVNEEGFSATFQKEAWRATQLGIAQLTIPKHLHSGEWKPVN